jgi:hypothetical protein
MLYSILIYDSEAVVGNLSKSEFDALIARHEGVQRKLAAEGKLGPVARLMPTTAATTLRKGEVLDGPFAETKEQLLGLYFVQCATLEDALGMQCAYVGSAPRRALLPGRRSVLNVGTATVRNHSFRSIGRRYVNQVMLDPPLCRRALRMR